MFRALGAVGAVFYPAEHFSLMVAPGAEIVRKSVESHGTVERETETEFLLRLGVGYGFPITATASVGPAVFADYADERWTTVAGVSLAVGF